MSADDVPAVGGGNVIDADARPDLQAALRGDAEDRVLHDDLIEADAGAEGQPGRRAPGVLHICAKITGGLIEGRQLGSVHHDPVEGNRAAGVHTGLAQDLLFEGEAPVRVDEMIPLHAPLREHPGLHFVGGRSVRQVERRVERRRDLLVGLRQPGEDRVAETSEQPVAGEAAARGDGAIVDADVRTVDARRAAFAPLVVVADAGSRGEAVRPHGGHSERRRRSAGRLARRVLVGGADAEDGIRVLLIEAGELMGAGLRGQLAQPEAGLVPGIDRLESGDQGFQDRQLRGGAADACGGIDVTVGPESPDAVLEDWTAERQIDLRLIDGRARAAQLVRVVPAARLHEDRGRPFWPVRAARGRDVDDAAASERRGRVAAVGLNLDVVDRIGVQLQVADARLGRSRDVRAVHLHEGHRGV